MKKIIFITILICSKIAIAQNPTALIRGTIENLVRPVSVYLRIKGKIVDSTTTQNGSFKFVQNVDDSQLTFYSLKIDYGFDKMQDNTHAILLHSGLTTIEINYPIINEMIKSLKGPKMVSDYEKKLIVPVLKYNEDINLYNQKLRKARIDRLQDTMIYKKAIDNSVKLCFGFPRAYVNENPSSLLSIIALTMMGRGDPTMSNFGSNSGLSELHKLFESLSADVRLSSEGKKYEENMFK